MWLHWIIRKYYYYKHRVILGSWSDPCDIFVYDYNKIEFITNNDSLEPDILWFYYANFTWYGYKRIVISDKIILIRNWKRTVFCKDMVYRIRKIDENTYILFQAN